MTTTLESTMARISHRLVAVSKASGACACGETYSGAEIRAQHAAHKLAPVAPVAPAVPASAPIRLVFEREAACSRCGGTGRMPFAAYGGVCFRCNGTGARLTPAGASALKLYNELWEAATERKIAHEVEVGDVVTERPGKWYTVREVTFSSRSGHVVDGRCEGSVTLMSKSCGYVLSLDAEVKLRPSVAVRREIAFEVARRRKGATVEAVEA